MRDQLTNDAQTTLASAIGSTGATSISVVSAAPFPSSAPFRIRIDDELLLVTAGAGTTTWTVTRGIEGTTAATHTSNSPVAHVVTAETLRQLSVEDRIFFGV